MEHGARQVADPASDAEAFEADGYAEAVPAAEVRMLRSLLGNLDGMAFRCLGDAARTLQYVSAGCVRLTGHLPDDLVPGRRVDFASLIHPDDAARRAACLSSALESRDRYTVEYRILRADGQVRWVWERGVPLLGPDARPRGIEGYVEDITERKHYEEGLAEGERRYHSMFENALEGIFHSTPDGRYLVANPAMARIFGYASPQELIQSVRDMSRQTYVEPGKREELLRRLEREGSVTGFEYQAYRRDGEIIWVSLNAQVKRDADGRVTHYEGTVEDVTERRRYQSHIEQQANFDTLTGLANRALLNAQLVQAVAAAEGGAGSVAVAFIDLDQFKFINDSFGHPFGDALLRTMAQRLQSSVRERDTVARQGGDEFVLVLRDYRTAEELTGIVQRIQHVVAEPWSAGRREFHVACSIGVAVHPRDGRSAEVLLRNADAAMYKAKQSGRNRFQFFTPELNRMMVERLSIEHKLRSALTRKQFVLHYQPRVNLRTGRIVGVEALLRWRVPRGGLYPPGRFIAVAEDTGLIVPIGKWALRAACEQARGWQIQGLPPMTISVNVSPRQFFEGNLVRNVREALAHSGLAPQWLQLELTESMMMDDADKFVSMLKEIRGLGVQIAIDDFGTGYSSLSYLKRFPVDYLKIDRSFVTDFSVDGDAAAIVQAIIALGHKLKLRVVAEGVETAEQHEFLRRSRCDEMQGFYFCKPVAAGEIAALLAGHEAASTAAC